MTINIQKSLGKRIQELRKLKGLSQEVLAEKINIATNTMSNIERGNAFMTASTLEKIVAVLETTPSELFLIKSDNYKEDTYKHIVSKIKLIKDNSEKLDMVKKILDAIL